MENLAIVQGNSAQSARLQRRYVLFVDKHAPAYGPCAKFAAMVVILLI